MSKSFLFILYASGHIQPPSHMGTEPGVRRDKRSLLACHTRYKCSMETTRNSVKVMTLVESLIGWEFQEIVKDWKATESFEFEGVIV